MDNDKRCEFGTKGVRDRATTEVRWLLRKHRLLRCTPIDVVRSLAFSIRRARRKLAPPVKAMTSRDRARASSKIRMLLRHPKGTPRNAAARENALSVLIGLLNSLSAVVKIKAASDFSFAPVLKRLRTDSYGEQDLRGLLAVIETLPAGWGAAPPQPAFLPLVRGGVDAWESCKRKERYSSIQTLEEPALEGPLPNFLRDLIKLSGLPMPNAEALRAHLMDLKKR